MTKILLLDDSMTILKVVRLTFAANSEYQILWARTSSEAEKMIAADHPDAIIGYVHFAAEKSVEFFKRMRTLQSNILFLAETMEDILAFKDAGFSEFLQKPFVSDDLRSAVDRILKTKNVGLEAAPLSLARPEIQEEIQKEIPSPPPLPKLPNAELDLNITQMASAVVKPFVVPLSTNDEPNSATFVSPPIPPSLRATVRAPEFRMQQEQGSIQFDSKQDNLQPEMSFDLENLEKTYRATLTEIPSEKTLAEDNTPIFTLTDAKKNEALGGERLGGEAPRSVPLSLPLDAMIHEEDIQESESHIELVAKPLEPFVVEDVKLNTIPQAKQFSNNIASVFQNETTQTFAGEFGGQNDRTVPNSLIIDSKEVQRISKEVLDKIDVDSIHQKLSSQLNSKISEKFDTELSKFKSAHDENFSALKIQTKEQFSELKIELQNGLLKSLRNELKNELLSALQQTISFEIKDHIAKWAQTEALIICKDEIQKTIQRVMESNDA